MFAVWSRHSVVVGLATRPSGLMPAGARGMASLKELKLRMKAVASISKLTKTMQMVASSKMRGAERKFRAIQPFKEGTDKIVDEAVGDVSKKGGNNLMVVVTTDKGMCGAINNQLLRHCKHMLLEDGASQYTISTTGTKGSTALARLYPDQFILSCKDLGKKDFSYLETGFVVDKLLTSKAAAANFNSVSVMFNKFRNALSYVVTEKKIPGPDVLMANLDKFAAYEFEEDEDATMRDLFEFQVGATIWSSLFENRTSELAARMTSMDSATKNAVQIVNLLTLQFNRGRQSAITTELIEITSGASAISSGD